MAYKVYNTDDNIEIFCDDANKLHISIEGADMFKCKTILAHNVMKMNDEDFIQLSIVEDEFKSE